MAEGFDWQLNAAEHCSSCHNTVVTHCGREVLLLCCGPAGAPVEGLDWQRITAEHPGGLRDMIAGTNQFAVQHQPGTYTDDSQMAFALAKSLVGGDQHACVPDSEGQSSLLAEPLVCVYQSKTSPVLGMGC